MKGFWLILLLAGLLVTGYLVFADLQAKKDASGGPARIGAVEKADRARKAVEEANKAQERLLQGASRE